ncbi:hypothetical protein ACI8AA_14695 [Geodermatophilus sp. SYSU D01180]
MPSSAGQPAVLPPPVGHAPVGPSPAGPSPAAPRKSRRGLLVGAGGVAALGVLGAVGYVVVDQLTGAGGADSPEAAVLELSAAASAEDAATALSLLPPGEVGPLVELYEDVEAKATSTGVAAEADPLAGFDLRLDDVRVQVEELGEDVAAVTVTGGTVSWTVDPGQMQGALRIDADGDVREGAEGSADLVEVTTEATDGAPLRIMTVQRDGDWYVSPTYTLLEAWRTSQGLPAPDFTQELDLADTGADSAEAAVQQAAQAAASYDVDGLLDLLSPDEAAALYQYRDAVVTALHRDGALAELQSEGQLEITSVDAVAGEEVGDHTPVTVRSASGGVYDDDGDYTSWTLDRTCVSWNEDGDTDGACLDEVFADEGLAPETAAGLDALTVLTQEVDGRWYLSPLATLVADVRQAVSDMDADAVATVLGVPQFGGVDGRLEDGATVDGTAAWNQPALYEIDVPAGSVVSTCVEGDAYASLYGPEGRPAGEGAGLATEGGVHRVVVVGTGDEPEGFTLRPVLSSVEQVTLPAVVEPTGEDACGWRVLEFQATAGEPLLFSTEGGSGVEVTTPGGETVWATGFVPEESGAHRVTVPADQPIGIEPLTAALAIGGSAVVSEDETGSALQYVLLREGESAQIDVQGVGTTVPSVELYTADYDYVDEDSPYYYSDQTSTVYADEPGLYLLDMRDIGYYGGVGTFQVTIGAY